MNSVIAPGPVVGSMSTGVADRASVDPQTSLSPETTHDYAWLVAALRTIAGAATGSGLGYLIVQAQGVSPLLGAMVGAIIGVLVLGVARPEVAEDWFGRGLFAVSLGGAGAVLAVSEFGLGMIPAWVLCSLSLLVASREVPGEDGSLADWVFRGAVASVVVGLGLYLAFDGAPLSAAWTLAFGAVMGLGGFLVGWLQVSAGVMPEQASRTKAAAAVPAASKTQTTASSVGAVAPGPTATAGSAVASGTPESLRFEVEAQSLTQAANALDALIAREPEPSHLVAMRPGIQTLLADLQTHLERWRTPEFAVPESQVLAARRCLDEDVARLESLALPTEGSEEGSSAEAKAQLVQLVAKRRTMVQMHQEIAEAGASFAQRLQEVTAEIELAALTMRRNRLLGIGAGGSEMDALAQVLDALKVAPPTATKSTSPEQSDGTLDDQPTDPASDGAASSAG